MMEYTDHKEAEYITYYENMIQEIKNTSMYPDRIAVKKLINFTTHQLNLSNYEATEEVVIFLEKNRMWKLWRIARIHLLTSR